MKITISAKHANKHLSSLGTHRPKMLIVAASFLLVTSANVDAGFFMGLGDLHGGFFLSEPEGISADGAVVVGRSFSGPDTQTNVLEAFRWTAETGMVGLGDLLGGATNSAAIGVSEDGAVVVGRSFSDKIPPGTNEPFRWSSETGMVGLLDATAAPNISNGGAVDTSSDGAVVIGSVAVLYGSNRLDEAMRWNAQSGIVLMGNIPGGVPAGPGYVSRSNAISADGSVIVGVGTNALALPEAFRWTEVDGMVGLGSLPGGLEWSQALGVSADGTVIVGNANGAANGTEAFRWTAATGMLTLGNLPAGGVAGVAVDASADGSVIIGNTGLTPLIWDAINGWRYLSQVLINYVGLDLTGWTLQDVRAISDDGLTVTGRGRNPTGQTEAWIANLSTNTPPVAEAGANQAVHVGSSVQLDGSGSYDLETATEDLLYTWQFISLPASSSATLAGADTAIPTFVADLLGDYVVSLVVTDEGGLESMADEVTVSSLNAPPNADAGPDQGTYVGAFVALDGSGSSDPDGDPLSYAWTMTSIPTDSIAALADADTVSPFFYPDVPGIYDIYLVVNDGYVDSSPDTMTVVVSAIDDYVCLRSTDTLNLVANLPASSVTTTGNQTALENFLRLGCENAQKGNTGQARHKLEQALERTDGCTLRGTADTGDGGGSGMLPAKDYIITCADQEAVYPLIEGALEALTY